MSPTSDSVDVTEQSYLAALCRAIPYHIVERVLATPTEAAFEPRSLQGCVLSADLAGFTSLVDSLTATDDAGLTEISQLLDRLFTAMQTEAFFPLGGHITEFGGDGVTAVFWGEGNVSRAVTAGLQIIEAIEREIGMSPDAHLRALKLRVGVAAGPFRLSVIGDLTRRMTFCGGSATHRAIALQASASPGSLVVDAEVVAGLGPELRCREVQPGRFIVDALDPRAAPAAYEYLGDRIKGDTLRKIQLLEPFVPAALARRLRTTPNGWRLEPEVRRGVVVMFADIVGFHTEHPEQFARGQDLARSLMRAIHKFDGLILKCIAIETGHRVMILFGAQHVAGNESEKAVLAATEAVTRMRGFQASLPGALMIRIGLHRGPVFFGSMGGRSKHDLTALGDTVNVAARAAAAANPLSVVATEDVASEVADIFAMTSMGEVRFKGKPRAIELHEIHGVKGGRSHYARRRTRRRFSAGRSGQETAIDRCIERSQRGVGAIIGISGSAGTGKSHILSNAVDRWIELGGLALVSRCLYAHRTVPLAPVREILDTFLGVSESDPDTERMTRIRARMTELGLADEPTLLSFMVPVRRPDGIEEVMLDLSDPDAADRLVRGIVGIFGRRIEQQKVMYVLEDIHLADSLTLRLVEALARVRKDRPYLLVTTYRPDPRLMDVRGAFDLELELDQLERDEADELVRHETRAQAVDDDLSRFLWQRGQGNPEHLIETVRFLSDRWLIRVDEHDRAVPIVAMESLEEIVPPTWAQVAVARLDGTTELERRVLRTASAIGFEFRSAVLSVVEEDLPGDVLETSLRGLEHQMWVRPEGETRNAYRFRDEVTRSVAYSLIPEGDRRVLHRRIAGAIEKCASGEPALVPALAHHWERAGDVDRAVALWNRVIEQVKARGLSADVQRFVSRLVALRDRVRQG